MQYSQNSSQDKVYQSGGQSFKPEVGLNMDGELVNPSGEKPHMRAFHRPFLPVLLALAAGIWLGGQPWIINAVSIKLIMFLAMVCFGFTIAELFWRRQTLAGPLLLFVCLGMLAISPYLNPKFGPEHVRHYVDNTRYTVTGVVVSLPEFYNERQYFEVEAVTVMNNAGNYPVHGKLRVTYDENALLVPYGAEVVFKGYLREIHSFRNPAGFDYERFSLLRGLNGNVYVRTGDLTVYDPLAYGSGALKTLYKFRSYIAGLIKKNVDGAAMGVLEALLTGNRRNIDLAVTDSFSKTGLSHVLAISGLHVGIVSLCFCLLFMLALKPIPWFGPEHRRRGVALLLALLPVFIYCVFSGFSPSTKRAFIVMVIFIAGFASLRLQDSFNSAVCAALVILALFPEALYSVSFQLSFAAIFGIIFGYRVLKATGLMGKLARRTGVRYLQYSHPQAFKIAGPVFYWVVSCFFMSLFAILATAPVVMHYFFNFSGAGLWLNLLMIPILTFIVLPCGVLAMLFSWWPWLAGILLKVAGWFLNYGIEVTVRVAAMPHSSGKAFAPSILEMLCYYGVLFALFYWLFPPKWQLGKGGFLLSRRDNPYLKACAAVTLICLLGLAGSTVYWLKDRYFRDDVKVTFIDIGQGNATFFEYPRGFNVLVDGGGFRSASGFDVGKNVLEPFLRHRKVAAIDLVVLTHGDFDHVGGLFYIMQNFRVGKVVMPAFDSNETLAFKETLTAERIPWEYAAQGTTLYGRGGFEALVLNPPANITQNYLRKQPDVNDCSLVLKVNCAGYSVLLTGDISKQVEAYLVGKYGGQLHGDVLLSPHHGSKTSNTTAFVEAVQPHYVVFSAGYNNYYNFPNPAVVATYEAQGSRILRTDLMGAIEFRFKPDNLKLKTCR